MMPSKIYETRLKQAISLSEVSEILIQLCNQIGNKIELHIHIDITRIGHTTFGDNSPISGDITNAEF